MLCALFHGETRSVADISVRVAAGMQASEICDGQRCRRRIYALRIFGEAESSSAIRMFSGSIPVSIVDFPSAAF